MRTAYDQPHPVFSMSHRQTALQLHLSISWLRYQRPQLRAVSRRPTFLFLASNHAPRCLPVQLRSPTTVLTHPNLPSCRDDRKDVLRTNPTKLSSALGTYPELPSSLLMPRGTHPCVSHTIPTLTVGATDREFESNDRADGTRPRHGAEEQVATPSQSPRHSRLNPERALRSPTKVQPPALTHSSISHSSGKRNECGHTRKMRGG